VLAFFCRPQWVFSFSPFHRFRVAQSVDHTTASILNPWFFEFLEFCKALSGVPIGRLVIDQILVIRRTL
jgi:hypothetical protein